MKDTIPSDDHALTAIQLLLAMATQLAKELSASDPDTQAELLDVLALARLDVLRLIERKGGDAATVTNNETPDGPIT